MTWVPSAKQARSVVFRAMGLLAILTAVTYVDFRLHLNATTAGFTYVVAALLIASFVGTAEAVVTSFIAVAAFNYFFIPPILTFTVADPQNWVALLALLTTTLVGSRLAARAREQTKDALDRRREMELLYTLSRSILLSEPGEAMTRRITYEVAHIFEFSSVALYDARKSQTFFAGPEELGPSAPELEHVMREAAVSGASVADAPAGMQVFAVRLGGHPIGSLAVRPLNVSDTAIRSLTNLVAVTLEKTLAQESATQMEAERQSDKLKSTLIDAIAHEFKTPLTSIKAAASMLLTKGDLPAVRVRELGTIMDEESDRLERLVSEAIQMARIEGGKLQMNRREIEVGDVIQTAIQETGAALDGHEVHVEKPDGTVRIFADSEMIDMALRQLLQNAGKYSRTGSPIEIRAVKDEAGALIEVQDHGPGIPESEQSRIFEKYYRSASAASSTAGTGIGLTIVREIVKAHGGRIWVESRPGTGARFSMWLPGGASGGNVK
jgi:two-component system sensor histidine kinase KdpD